MFLNAQPCVLNKSLDVLSEFVFLFTHTSAERADAALICSFSGWKTPSEPAPFCSFSPETHTYCSAEEKSISIFQTPHARERERECVGCCAQRRGSCSSQSLLYVADKWSSLVTNRVPHANLARPRCCREKIQCWCFGELKMQPTYMVLTKDWVPRLKIKEELEAMRKLQSLISLHDATKLVKIYVLKYQATGNIAKIQTNELSMGKSTVENIYWFLSSLSVIILLNLTCA